MNYNHLPLHLKLRKQTAISCTWIRGAGSEFSNSQFLREFGKKNIWNYRKFVWRIDQFSLCMRMKWILDLILREIRFVTVWPTQLKISTPSPLCEYLRIFLPHTFYVKSILLNLLRITKNCQNRNFRGSQFIDIYFT